MQGVVSRPDVRKQHPTESLALLSDSGWTMLDLYTTVSTPCLQNTEGVSEQYMRDCFCLVLQAVMESWEVGRHARCCIPP